VNDVRRECGGDPQLAGPPQVAMNVPENQQGLQGDTVKQLIIKWIVNSTALLVVAHVVSGVTLDNWVAVFIAALVLGLLNAFLRPVLIFLTLPVTVLTLGLFTLVINAFLFYLAAHLVRGFHVADFWHAFVAALIFSFVSFLLNIMVRSD
jgi:putative membrane protein